jgi:hypothetical protein
MQVNHCQAVWTSCEVKPKSNIAHILIERMSKKYKSLIYSLPTSNFNRLFICISASVTKQGRLNNEIKLPTTGLHGEKITSLYLGIVGIITRLQTKYVSKPLVPFRAQKLVKPVNINIPK